MSPSWMPYRLRNHMDQRRILRALAELDKTPATPAVAPQRADAELHMLLCKRDLQIGVLAMKSLLRFTPPDWAVCVSDDGSLTHADHAWIDSHIPGNRRVTWPDAGGLVDMALHDKPRLKAMYHSKYAPVCKLLHPMLLARCNRVVVLDPDTAFFARPQKLIDFATLRHPGPWYLHDHQDETKVVPPEVNQALDELAKAIAPQGRTWRLQHRLFNSGLLAYQPARLDLMLAENICNRWRICQPRCAPGKRASGLGTGPRSRPVIT
ncbi:MAG: hypothetical protein HC898_00725 [Phycisphaerales bacterium]|nr:hypothetical protein [Phycisphaerales bacterium]